MYYNGDVMFSVSHTDDLTVDFGSDMLPTKIVKKGDVVALGKKAQMNRWLYKINFEDEEKYFDALSELVQQLYEKKEYIKHLMMNYKDVSVTIHIRSDYGQLGYSLPNSIIKKMGEIGCDVYFDILSFGQVL